MNEVLGEISSLWGAWWLLAFFLWRTRKRLKAAEAQLAALGQIAVIDGELDRRKRMDALR